MLSKFNKICSNDLWRACVLPCELFLVALELWICTPNRCPLDLKGFCGLRDGEGIIECRQLIRSGVDGPGPVASRDVVILSSTGYREVHVYMPVAQRRLLRVVEFRQSETNGD